MNNKHVKMINDKKGRRECEEHSGGLESEEKPTVFLGEEASNTATELAGA